MPMSKILRSKVQQDQFTDQVSQVFDYEFDGTTSFAIPSVEFPTSGLGLIVGPSGSGKSSLLKTLGDIKKPRWNRSKAIISHFDSPDEGIERLMSVGLNTIPSWLKPFHVLSTGEQFRANLARSLVDYALIDEFTSVVDRTVAYGSSVALSRYVREKELTVTLASCHRDIIEWLTPDWVFDTLDNSLVVGRLQRPRIEISVYKSDRSWWPIFRQHHYLSSILLSSARCFTAYWNDTLVGFASSIAMPNGYVKNAWREHRTVILPDFQGLGIGVRLSDFIAALHVNEGKRYFSRTAHPRMGNYRDKSILWRATSKNKKRRTDYTDKIQGRFNNYRVNTMRLAWSHEYTGKENNVASGNL